METFFHRRRELARTPAARPRCLLVDDRDENLLALEALLRDEPAELYKARSGEEALELFLKNEFAVALVDVQMPGMDGFALAELLRSSQRTRHVPIIFVTAAGREAARLFRGYESGAVDFLFKPLDPFVVRCKVRVFLELDSQRRRLQAELQRTERALFEAEAARRALAQSEQRYRVIGDALPFGVWMCRPDGRIEYASSSFCELLGVSLETLQQSGAAAHLHPDERQEACARWRRCLDTGEPWYSELRLRGHDSRYRAVLSRGLPVHDAKGRIASWVGINLDIDARKAMERELRSAHDLRAQLLSVVSHDLRNPLNAIVFTVPMLQRTIRTEPDARMLDRIASAAKRMDAIIGQLLDFSRAREANGFPISPSPCDLRQVCDAIVDELRMAHPGCLISVDGPAVLEGVWDCGALGQVLSNLVGNAIQHGDGGQVFVRLREDSARVRIDVQNGGDPIPPDVLPHIFDACRRGTEKRAHTHSLGLGLFITRRIVEAHGGTIDVRSTPEEGTCFTVVLPPAVSDPGTITTPSEGTRRQAADA